MRTLAAPLMVLAVTPALVTSQFRLEDLTKDVLPDVMTRAVDAEAIDLDGDGHLDLVLGKHAYRNRGDGTFEDRTAQWLPSLQFTEWEMEFGDLDGDGDQDAIAARAGSPVAVLINDGTGALTDATVESGLPTFSLRAFSIFDADGDGDEDVLLETRLFLNDGSATFTEATGAFTPAISTSLLIWATATGDLDDDGDLDVVVPNTGPSGVYLNDGTGQFTGSGRSITSSTKDLTLVDANGDGLPDIVAVTPSTSLLYLNQGAGSFVNTPGRIPGSHSSWGVAAGDLDQDGDVDLFIANDDTDQLLLNDGQGFFSEAPKSEFRPRDLFSSGVAFADLDGDSDLEIVLTVDTATKGGYFDTRDHLYVNADGVFLDAAATVLTDEGLSPAAILADLNGDRLPELIESGLGGIYVHENLRGAAFGPRVLTAMSSNNGQIIAADIDGDGDLDLLHNNAVIKNDGDGNLVVAGGLPVAGPNIAAGDIDGDGDLDVAVGDPLTIMVNDGAGVFTVASTLPIVTNVTALAFTKLDGDSHLDLVVTNVVSGNPAASGLSSFINDGNGGFTRIAQFAGGNMPSFSLDDIDKDGDIDVWTQGPRVLLNDGTGVFTLDTGRTPNTGPVRCAYPADFDNDGDNDLVATKTIAPCELWENTGNGFFQDVTATAWNAPLATGEDPVIADIDGDRDLDVLYIHQSLPHQRVYLNMAQHLEAPRMARLGTTYSTVIHALNGQAAALLLHLVPLPTPIATPFGLQQIDLNTAFASPILTMTSNQLQVDIPLPASLPLVGIDLYVQAVVARFGVGVRFTNLVVDRIFI